MDEIKTVVFGPGDSIVKNLMMDVVNNPNYEYVDSRLLYESKKRFLLHPRIIKFASNSVKK